MAKNRKANFVCNCGYYTDNKYNFDRHKKTTHKDLKNKYFICLSCKKRYKYRSGLSRHKKKCKKIEIVFTEKIDEHIVEPIIFSEPKNKQIVNHGDKYEKLINVIMEQNKTITKNMSLLEETIKTNETLAKNVGNNNNNKININVFLNEKCKNAMNLTDFMNNLKITLEDILYTKDNGTIKGIENILKKQLISLEPRMRPIHCSDKKRLQFYIKDKDKWDKENSELKIKKSVDWISKLQIHEVIKWEKNNPDYLDNDKKNKEWRDFISNIMGNSGEQPRKRCMKSISKLLANETYINLKH